MNPPRAVYRLIAGLDFTVVVALLGAVSIVPIAFLVPFNDEWMRIDYLGDHSVWEWTVMHVQTWVVRPTSELIMALAAVPNTRPALAHDFTPRAFLARFHAVCVVLVLVYWLVLYALAAALAKSWRALPHTTLLLFGVLTCWCMANDIEYAFYWIDGYGNLLIPFALGCTGLVLVVRQQLVAAVAGAVLVVVAALAHEVLALYVLGVVLLALVFRRPETCRWQLRVLWAVLLSICAAVVLWQMFGAGPSTRNAEYARSAGARYDLASAWQNIATIVPLRAALSVMTALLAIAVYRNRLGDLPERAEADARQQRWFWILLALGTFLTSFLPLASVGLVKVRLAGSYYSVATHLLFGLLGAVLYPLLARPLDLLVGAYRRQIGSLLPLVVLVAVSSGNIADFRSAAENLPNLRADAFEYMRILFEAPKDARLRMCRPKHRYSKPGRTLTDHCQQRYFGIAFIYNRCYGERREPKQEAQ